MPSLPAALKEVINRGNCRRKDLGNFSYELTFEFPMEPISVHPRNRTI